MHTYRRNSTLLRCQYDVVKDSESCNEEFARVYATFSYYVGKRGLPSNCKLGTVTIIANIITQNVCAVISR